MVFGSDKWYKWTRLTAFEKGNGTFNWFTHFMKIEQVRERAERIHSRRNHTQKQKVAKVTRNNNS